MKRKYKQTELGMIPEHWELRIVKDVCEINRSSISKDYPYKEIEYIDITSVDKGTILESKRIKLNDAPSRAKRIVKDNDIILSTVRPNLKHFAFIKIAKPNLVVSTGFAVITCTDIVPEYLYYFLSTDSYTNYLSAIAEGHTSAYPAINPDVIENSIVPYPTIKEQQIIAKILSDFDAQINLNRQINQTLEQIAQAIFKSWFVNFDPAKAKIEAKEKGEDPERAAMCVISGKSDMELEQLSPEQLEQLAKTAALFPDELEESELGMIPKGWEVKPLDKIATYTNGLAMQKFPPRDNEQGLPVIKIAELRSGFTESTSRASKDLDPLYLVNDGDILFSWSGSLLVKQWHSGRGALNQHLFKITSSEYPKWFYYFATITHLPWFQSIAEGKATTMGHIQRHHLSQALIAVANDEIRNAAGNILQPLTDMSLQVMLEARSLSDIRELLLPKLLLGDVVPK